MRRRQSDISGDKFEVDPHPTPDAEAEDFDNSDERLKRQQLEHERAILKIKQGLIGRLSGSTNESYNSGLLILMLLLFLLGFTGIGMFLGASGLSSVVDILSKAIFAVIGFVFGAKDTARKR